MNKNSKFLILVAMAIFAAAFGVFGLTSLDAGHTMRGLLCYILACSLVTCMCVVAGSVYVAERFAAMHASTAALWKGYYAATQTASARIPYAYAGAGSPEPKEDSQARQRRELEQVLVNGAAHHLSNDPSRAAELANGVKAFMATLHGTAGTTLPVIDPGPDSLEREIQAKANKAPRVTPEALQAEIASASYFTAADGVRGASAGMPGADLLPEYATHDGSPLSLLTVCVLVLRNGYTVVGHSACASPENFNAEIGQRIARENAEREIWPLLGFRLRDELADVALPA